MNMAAVWVCPQKNFGRGGGWVGKIFGEKIYYNILNFNPPHTQAIYSGMQSRIDIVLG